MIQVSVIMPAYNAERYIEEAIDSVLKQTFSDFELIIVNDCSNDNTRKVIDKAIKEDPRCFVIDLKENKGKAHALNIGIQQARGALICILDTDDIFFSDKLEQQVKFMNEHPEVDMLYGGAKYFSDSEEELEQREVLDSSEDLYANLKKAGEKTLEELNSQHHGILNKGDATITSCSVMIRRKIFAVCKFDENLRNIEDYDMWYQIIGKGFKIHGIKKPFYYYRVHKNQKSANPEKRQLAKNIIFNKIISGEYFKD
ncbi:MAG TPA: glycosyltransferase family 2 protein [Candidatus Nanoarchaeia archaeon]|nr:glycosyltransferase family 2 protein [Candidatus Nanoarchaeia archaeon]